MSEVIVVTSGKGGVGKSTTTANLGVGLAMRGQKVVLIDTDTGLRNLDLLLGLENRIMYDLVDVIEGRVEIKKALVRHKKFDNLQLLPTSQVKDKSAVNPADLMVLCDELRKEYDYVIIDCPAGIEQGFQTAIAAADVVLMDDNPLQIAKAQRLARKTMRIVRQNIWGSIGIKVLVLMLGAVGIANMWAAIFADVGVMTLAVLNAMRAMMLPKDVDEEQKNRKDRETMKTYKIDVDCANCANLMEEAAQNTPGIKSAAVNFMALKMKVEFEEGADPKQVMENVRANCKKVEEDCEVFI